MMNVVKARVERAPARIISARRRPVTKDEPTILHKRSNQYRHSPRVIVLCFSSEWLRPALDDEHVVPDDPALDILGRAVLRLERGADGGEP